VRLLKQVDLAVSKGATVTMGGKRIDSRGSFMAPTISTNITAENPAFREEFLGPVALFFRVKDEEAAIALANDSDFGLGGSVFTKDVARGKRVASRIDTGMVFINNIHVCKHGGPAVAGPGEKEHVRVALTDQAIEVDIDCFASRNARLASCRRRAPSPPRLAWSGVLDQPARQSWRPGARPLPGPAVRRARAAGTRHARRADHTDRARRERAKPRVRHGRSPRETLERLALDWCASSNSLPLAAAVSSMNLRACPKESVR
jgi:Aldehyde dehydrogenase family